MVKEEKSDNTKTYSFTSEELSFLLIRQQTLNFTSTINSDTKAVMDGFIMSQVLPRLGIDPTKYEITFDIGKGTLSVVDKIILPNNGQPIIKT